MEVNMCEDTNELTTKIIKQQLSLLRKQEGVDQNNNNLHESSKIFNVVSLFSGCGGLDLGFVGDFKFRQLNFSKNPFKIVLSNDIDSAAAHVYNANTTYFDHKILLDDVKNVSSVDIPDCTSSI